MVGHIKFEDLKAKKGADSPKKHESTPKVVLKQNDDQRKESLIDKVMGQVDKLTITPKSKLDLFPIAT